MKHTFSFRITCIFIFVLMQFILVSCGTSSSTTTYSDGVQISNYHYVVFGNSGDGDGELDDILLIVQNEIARRLHVVNSINAIELINKGESVLSPKISVKSEKWDGGHTYITISFYDYSTNMMSFVVKSSGIGLSIDEDKKLALKAIRKELDKVLPIIK